MILAATSAIKTHNNNKRSDGNRCFAGLFALKRKYCAATIKNPIKRAENKINEGNQIPTISKVAKTVFEKPTKLLTSMLNPN